MNPDNPLLNFVEKQIRQIRLIRIGGVAIIIIIVLIATLSFINYLNSNSETLAYTPTIVETPEITAVVSVAATFTEAPTATATELLEPTPTTINVLGYGNLLNYVYPLEEPNGEDKGYVLQAKQPLTILERTDLNGSVWYKCKWEIDGRIDEGWFPEKYIQFGPPPTPTPSI